LSVFESFLITVSRITKHRFALVTVPVTTTAAPA